MRKDFTWKLTVWQQANNALLVVAVHYGQGRVRIFEVINPNICRELHTNERLPDLRLLYPRRYQHVDPVLRAKIRAYCDDPAYEHHCGPACTHAKYLTISGVWACELG